MQNAIWNIKSFPQVREDEYFLQSRYHEFCLKNRTIFSLIYLEVFRVFNIRYKTYIILIRHIRYKTLCF